MIRRKMIVNEEMIDHFDRIGSLLEAGYPLDISLSFVTQYASSEWIEKMHEVMYSLQEGYAVHQSFDVEGIPRSIILFLYFYERQGDLPKGFIEASRYLRHQLKWKNQLIKLVSYPFFLLLFSGLLMSMMYLFVLPNFTAMISTTSSPAFVFTFVELLKQAPLVLLLCCVCFILFFLLYMNRLKNLSPLHKINHFIKIPLIGRVLKLLITYFFSLQLGRMLTAGMTIQQALQQIQDQPYVELLKLESERLMVGLRSGQSLSEVIEESPIYQKEFSSVLANGFRTGYVATDLIYYSSILYAELERMIQKGLNRIQPIMFMLIGFIVLFLFLATLLPVYEMLNTM
ncbi:competence type IV pilus assembly protein ComGB [Halalkalibacter sp. AB-rgal2]|uniref:competence type IV pilus assembly protein ComGB n=1 Tax=Halalkalibacter sp. AB-rgal2 TaxID=3242695 RepID=UPI00359EAE04